MRFCALRIFVGDLAAARHFYGHILGLPAVWDHDGTAIGFDLGVELIVELVGDDADPEDRALRGRFTGASIAVDDINRVYGALIAKGVRFTGLPERQPWGGVLAHFQDPSGNVITLVES